MYRGNAFDDQKHKFILVEIKKFWKLTISFAVCLAEVWLVVTDGRPGGDGVTSRIRSENLIFLKHLVKQTLITN